MSTAAANPLTPANFEVALQELENIVRSLEAGTAPIEESLAAYERGVGLLRYCQETVVAAEQRLLVLENGALRELSAAETEAGER